MKMKTNLGDKLKQHNVDKGFVETVPDTTKEDPQTLLIMGMAMGGSQAIERSEKEGQKALASSKQLPRKMNFGTDADLTDMGIKLGPNCEDKLFRFAELPEGWKIKPTEDHSMWSNIVDARGLPRVSIFYKAAFYDRDAFMGVKRSRFAVEVDYEKNKTGIVAVNITTTMPTIDGKDQPLKILKTFTHEKTFDPAKEFRAMYDAQDVLTSDAWKWAHETYDMSKQWELDL